MADPYAGKRGKVRKNTLHLKEKLGLQLSRFDEYEELLLDRIVQPDHISVDLRDVFGLIDIITELACKATNLAEDEMLCLNPNLRSIFANKCLWSPAKGVLLHGPPGTGKTMLAKALAKRARCTFLDIAPSAINSKFFGDANRLVHATFTLARKLQPCVIFVDEVDSLLARRGGLLESEGCLQVKNEFLALWDGMDSDANGGVLVMAATNRIDRLDEAALRRFTLCKEIPLPNRQQRKAILAGYLRKHAREASRGVAPQLLREAILAGWQVGDGSWGGGISGRDDGTDVLLDSRATTASTPLSSSNSTRGGSGSSSTAGTADGAGAGFAAGTVSGAGTQVLPADGGSATAEQERAGASGGDPAAAGPWQPRLQQQQLVPSLVLDTIADQTEGFSGCDLLKLCCKAAQSILHDPEVRARLRNMVATAAGSGEGAAAGRGGEEPPPTSEAPGGEPLLGLLRPVAGKDLLRALAAMKPSMQMPHLRKLP